MRCIIWMSFALLLCMQPVSAFAKVNYTEEGAAVLKQQVESMLAWHARMARVSGQGFSVAGDILVTPHKKYYRIEVPKVHVSMSAGFRLYMDRVVAHVVPGKGGEWHTSLSLPGAILLSDAGGQVIGHVLIGKQKFSGIWLVDMGMFHKLDIAYHNVTLVPRARKPKVGFSVDELKVGRHLQKGEGEGSLWKGSDTLTVKGLKAKLKTYRVLITANVEQAAYQSHVRNLDILNFNGVREIVSRAIDREREGEVPQSYMRYVIDSLMRAVRRVPDDYEDKITAQNIAVDVQSFSRRPRKKLPPQTWGVKELSFVSDARGLLKKTARIQGKVNMKGIDIIGFLPVFAGLLPQEMAAHVLFVDIPARQLYERFLELTSDDAEEEDGVKTFVKELPTILSQAGTQLIVSDTQAEAKDVAFSVEGALTAHETSKLLSVGKMALHLDGIDEAVSLYMSQPQTPASMQYLEKMVPFQARGALVRQGDGEELSRRLYDFEVTNRGQLLLNGVDYHGLAAVRDSPVKTVVDVEEKRDVSAPEWTDRPTKGLK